ncbi:soluble NSF attachment protein [Piptocephalis cylindrospora]|uniref:Soluble NSF attachment protein n=1 Tax=Piptocephalis cylindrospora TaxID=1907219 RepID=A0A4P9XZF3_9FUNG|nr:soluble NSF attachment protein [Piptocephalis cylindrospora]|eukprot:RKP11866.1 soluble NSF attachment protein [Piptocephalis cylindrospora]
MLTFILFLVAIGYYASKSIPALSTLQTQLKGTSSGLASQLVRRLFTAEPSIRIEQYGICAIAYVTSPGLEAIYLGIFHQWWRVSEIQEVSGSSSSGKGNGELVDKAESLQEDAIQARKNKQYARASDLYVQAARQFLTGGDDDREGMVDTSGMAGQCYEEASKCSKQAGRKEDSSSQLDKAIQAYSKDPNRLSRAATMAERQATLWSEDGDKTGMLRAAKALSKAADLYEQSDDGRSRFTRAKEGEMWAKLQRYTEALKAYDTSLKESTQFGASGTESLTLPPRYLCALFCLMGTGAEWEEVQAKAEIYSNQCSAFDSSPEARFIRHLCDLALEGATEIQAEAHRQTYRSGRMEPWQLDVFQKRTASLGDPSSGSFR